MHAYINHTRKERKATCQGLDRSEKSILDRIKVGDADDGDFDIVSTREPLYFLPCFLPFFLRAYGEKFHTKHLVLVFPSIIPVLYTRGSVYLAMNKLHDYVLVLINRVLSDTGTVTAPIHLSEKREKNSLHIEKTRTQSNRIFLALP